MDFNSCNQCINTVPIKNNRNKHITDDHPIEICKNKINSKFSVVMPAKSTQFSNGNRPKGSSKFIRGEGSIFLNSCNQCPKLFTIKSNRKQQVKASTDKIEENKGKVKIAEKWLVKTKRNPFDNG